MKSLLDSKIYSIIAYEPIIAMTFNNNTFNENIRKLLDELSTRENGLLGMPLA